jgi:phosphoglucosamine mutase
VSIRFGTDGVRGVANTEISVELALALGAVTAEVFGASCVVVGRDTRRSGTVLESAVAAGIGSTGAEAVLLGVVPTPAVAAVCAADDVPGVVISASHNPFGDNGLKVFAPGGRKLSDDQQAAVERRLDERLARTADVAGDGGVGRPTGADVGTVRHAEAHGRYADQVVAALDGRRLEGLSVVLDCANGANSDLAGAVFERVGARVHVIGDRPDGTNINDGCGSTHPQGLADEVVRRGADLGLAFDGDADRMVAVAGDGTVVSGDHTLALFATDLRDRGALAHDTVVVTVMTNLGFHRAMAAAGVQVVTTAVGDRSVLEALDGGGYSLGGEQSGHIIFADLSTTGDGLLAAVLLADLVQRHGRSLGELAAAAMTALPQVLVNVRVEAPMPDVAERVRTTLDAVQVDLGDDGRVLVRPSGTEPVVRVMVEATTVDRAERAAQQLADAVAAAAVGPGS